jgi:D-glycero-beta-D-manno-heptose-7-phosphate kinase
MNSSYQIKKKVIIKMDTKLIKVVDEFAKKRILVIGDLMLDHYVEGDVSRISPEAPIQIVKVKKERYVPGGAANTSNNISALKAKAVVIGLIGRDEAGKKLIKELSDREIDYSGVLVDDSRPTIEKTRFLGMNQQLLRVDKEITDDISEEIGKRIIKEVLKKIDQIDVMVISDYGKGVITEKLAKAIVKISKDYKKPLVVDPKPLHKSFYKNATIMTPNFKESSEIAGLSGENEDKFIEKVGNKIMNDLNINVLITRGPKGMSLFEKNKLAKHVPTKAREVYDVSGAGDTVVATMALALASGLNLEDAALIGNHAAGIVVGKIGTATVTPEELKSVLREDITDYLNESIKVKKAVIDTQLEIIEKITNNIINTYKDKKKILIFGNGGSASDAQHFAGELVGRFKVERKGLPAIALTTDTSILTSIGNDYGFDSIFERQLEALGNRGDTAIAFTTSGKSENITRGLKKAKNLGLKTILFTGKDGGDAVKVSDLSIIVPSNNTPRIQETHIALIHIICELLERELYGIK